MKSIINSKNAPKAIGPYSQAVEANGFLFLSGQLPLTTDNIMPESIESQTRQSIKNIENILQERNLQLDSVIEATVYLKNITDFAKMNKIYAEYFTKDFPARCAFSVRDLPANALVEIKVTALIK